MSFSATWPLLLSISRLFQGLFGRVYGVVVVWWYNPALQYYTHAFTSRDIALMPFILVMSDPRKAHPAYHDRYHAASRANF